MAPSAWIDMLDQQTGTMTAAPLCASPLFEHGEHCCPHATAVPSAGTANRTMPGRMPPRTRLHASFVRFCLPLCSCVLTINRLSRGMPGTRTGRGLRDPSPAGVLAVLGDAACDGFCYSTAGGEGGAGGTPGVFGAGFCGVSSLVLSSFFLFRKSLRGRMSLLMVRWGMR